MYGIPLNVVVDGQGRKSAESQFEHVYVLQEMGEGSARRLRELNEFLGMRLTLLAESAAPLTITAAGLHTSCL